MQARRSRAAGLTLIEVLIAIVVVGVLSAFAVARNSSPANYTAMSQGETLAANLRHSQALATSWNRSLTVTLSGGTLQPSGYMLLANNGTFTVKCANGSAVAPCNSTSAVTDPATGSNFTVSLEHGISVSGPSTLTFDSFGKPSAAASYTLAAGSITVTVAVAAVTGFVTVTGS
jgi:prepilin-type N-terminal cleavage/methylation domain-containing protein